MKDVTIKGKDLKPGHHLAYWSTEVVNKGRPTGIDRPIPYSGDIKQVMHSDTQVFIKLELSRIIIRGLNEDCTLVLKTHEIPVAHRGSPTRLGHISID